MTKKSGLFVKINYKNDGGRKAVGVTGSAAAKKDDLQVGKYFLCGGTYNKNGGTIIFQARDMEEANHIINNNPFSKYSMYGYEILKGDVIAL
jgi:uncharacterized protein